MHLEDILSILHYFLFLDAWNSSSLHAKGYTSLDLIYEEAMT